MQADLTHDEDLRPGGPSGGAKKTAAPDTAADVASIQTNAATKAADEFRSYDEATTPARVVQHYRDMRTHQTLAFYRRMEAKYSFEDGRYR